uniref:Uncharacterized protein n=1 Tax=Haptolina brevifila TaxID=156173 RepID=A0A7S2BBT1_9EUKA|mmetsp:Transcript_1129/g.2427  ORF Transcript_1129/g.2427 Transcript_1129/m.2427 type:complete len:149 (+) Transcript_1129:50-496(+)
MRSGVFSRSLKHLKNLYLSCALTVVTSSFMYVRSYTTALQTPGSPTVDPSDQSCTKRVCQIAGPYADATVLRCSEWSGFVRAVPNPRWYVPGDASPACRAFNDAVMKCWRGPHLARPRHIAHTRCKLTRKDSIPNRVGKGWRATAPRG